MKEEIVCTFFDLKRFARIHYRQVLRVSLLLTLGIIFFCLIKPLNYKHESTLRVLNELNSSHKLSEILPQVSKKSNADSTVSFLRSKRLLLQVIQELGLQVTCPVDSWFKRLFIRIQERWLFETNQQIAYREPFSFCHVTFFLEEPLYLWLQLTEDAEYILYDAKKQFLGKAPLGVAIETECLSLTLENCPKQAIPHVFYPLTVFPSEKALKFWQKRIRAFISRTDRALVQLEITYPDRYLGVYFLNRWMAFCETFTRKEQEEVYLAQIQSLKNYNADLITSYDQTLFNHIGFLEGMIRDQGSVGYREALEILSVNRNAALLKLEELEVELKRLENETFILPAPLHYAPISLQNNRLIREESPSCLSVPIASELLIDYKKQKQQLEAELSELLFLKERFKEPDFEISSLGGMFEDPVTRDIVTKASAIALQLKDTSNRSQREHERLLTEIVSQKSFLFQHLNQLVSLKERKIGLVERRIVSSKGAFKALLQSEQELMKQNLDGLKQRMAALPHKWYQESLLDLKRQQALSLLKGTEQLIASLEMERSSYEGKVKSLDLATIPVEPCAIRLTVIALVTACLIISGIYSVLLIRAFYRGLPVSSQLLSAWGFCAARFLAEGERLETVKGLADCIVNHSKEPPVFLSIGGKGVDYSFDLAHLLVKRGYKIVLIHALLKEGGESFNQMQVKELTCQPSFDRLTIEGADALDYVNSVFFKQRLSILKQQYECVLFYTNANPSKAEGVSLLRLADVVAISIEEEKKESLFPYFDWVKDQKNSKLTFICMHE